MPTRPSLFTFATQSPTARKIKKEFTLGAISGGVPQDRHKSPQEHHKMVQLHVHSDVCTALLGHVVPDCPPRARQLHQGSGSLAMPRYFQSFKVYGEVADLLLLERPERRLMIDISLEPALHEPGRNPYPHRTTFCLTDPGLMERFLSEFSIGDAIDAEGTFAQTDYIPHRTTCIDTTFLLLDFRRLADSEQLIPAPAEFAKDALRRMRLH
jgi:hypothetical protein